MLPTLATSPRTPRSRSPSRGGYLHTTEPSHLSQQRLWQSSRSIPAASSSNGHAMWNSPAGVHAVRDSVQAGGRPLSERWRDSASGTSAPQPPPVATSAPNTARRSSGFQDTAARSTLEVPRTARHVADALGAASSRLEAGGGADAAALAAALDQMWYLGGTSAQQWDFLLSKTLGRQRQWYKTKLEELASADLAAKQRELEAKEAEAVNLRRDVARLQAEVARLTAARHGQNGRPGGAIAGRRGLF